jgi:hypothetical protein
MRPNTKPGPVSSETNSDSALTGKSRNRWDDTPLQSFVWVGTEGRRFLRLGGEVSTSGRGGH